MRAALEVKGPKSSWQQFRTDIERLRQIRKVMNGKDQAAVFVYVTCPLSKAEREQVRVVLVNDGPISMVIEGL